MPHFWRNPAVRTQSPGADFGERRTCVWGPPVGPSGVHEAGSVGRVPRTAQHAGVDGVERRAAVGERLDVVERQVARWMRRMLGTIARAHVAVLADMARDHPPRQAGPSRISVDVMVGTEARQARMLGAAPASAAGDNTADRAQLHRGYRPRAVPPLTLVTLESTPIDIEWSVNGGASRVHPLWVLRLRGHAVLGGIEWDPAPLHRDVG